MISLAAQIRAFTGLSSPPLHSQICFCHLRFRFKLPFDQTILDHRSTFVQTDRSFKQHPVSTVNLSIRSPSVHRQSFNPISFSPKFDQFSPIIMAKQATASKPTAKTTAKKASWHCARSNKSFCYVCASYLTTKQRKTFTAHYQQRYCKIYGVSNLKNFGHCFSG